MNGHRSDLTKKPFLPVSRILTEIEIEQNCLWSDFQRENRERFWIKDLRVLHPDGINRKQ